MTTPEEHLHEVLTGAEDVYGDFVTPDPWDLLRYRWRDQLGLLSPDGLAMLQQELAPCEEAWKRVNAELVRAQEAYNNQCHAEEALKTRMSDVEAQLQRAKQARDSHSRNLGKANEERASLVEAFEASQAAEVTALRKLAEAQAVAAGDRTVLVNMVCALADQLLTLDPGTEEKPHTLALLLSDEAAALVEKEISVQEAALHFQVTNMGGDPDAQSPV